MKFLYSVLLVGIFLHAAYGSKFVATNNSGESKQQEDPSSSITMCGDDKDVLTVGSYTFSPNLLIKGEDLHIEASGTVNEVINAGAYATVKVKYGILTVANKTIDLCEKITLINKECPLKKGFFHISEVVEVPTSMPRGKYKVEVEAFTSDGKRVTCVHGVIRVSAHHDDNN